MVYGRCSQRAFFSSRVSPSTSLGLSSTDLSYRFKISFHEGVIKTLSCPPSLTLGKMTGGGWGNMEGLEKDGDVEEELPKGAWWSCPASSPCCFGLESCKRKFRSGSFLGPHPDSCRSVFANFAYTPGGTRPSSASRTPIMVYGRCSQRAFFLF